MTIHPSIVPTLRSPLSADHESAVEAAGAPVPVTMSHAQRTVEILADAGFTHATGVPCSLLSGLFFELERRDSPLRYIPAPREDSAIGVATGLALAGRKPIVLMQNSGLGYSLNVITSLNHIYDLGIPMIVSWRGRNTDAVEHDIIGREVTNLLALFDIPWTVFDPDDPEGTSVALLARAADSKRMSVLLVSEGMER